MAMVTATDITKSHKQPFNSYNIKKAEGFPLPSFLVALADDAPAVSPVHLDEERGGKLNEAQAVRLVFGGHGVEEAFVERAFALVGANGEIAHAKRREVLEKVRALARVYAEVLEPAFYDNLSARYVRPFHGNAQ